MSLVESAPSMTPQQRALTGASGLRAYRDFAFGTGALPQWLLFEFSQLFSGLPGALGYGIRALLYPNIFAECGVKPAFGKGMTLRRPAQISCGTRVVIDDYASLEVRGKDGQITLGDHVAIGRLSTLVAKGAHLSLGAGCNVGSYCRIATETKIEIGASVLIGAFSYIGAGNHQFGNDGRPLIEQRMEHKGGVSIGEHAWIGAGAMIMDGVTIGERAVVGAQSLVLTDVPADAVVVGSPARILNREPS